MLHNKICPYCSKQFQATHGQRRYCSRHCEYARKQDARDAWASERKRAINIVTAEVAAGRLIQRPCEVCGADRNIDAHHDDYSKPLDVRWLCRKHHMAHHRALRRAA
jgi:ribosomal protein S27AE